MVFMNLTPHEICLWKKTDLELLSYKYYPKEYAKPYYKIPLSGLVARINEEKRLDSECEVDSYGTIESIPIWVTTSREFVDLPEPRQGVLYIVSSLVNVYDMRRKDLIAPYEWVYDPDVRKKNRVIGCCGFIRRDR